ncbi:transglycosylase domain-containing protein [Nocardioides sp. CFH 31398]|uniref:transglycosylase domain-containing protein n=1 Tax=Nocardioides sp. CFH 31398 TaxID=2919579 RepID=UPI001F05C8B0|nr:transglycosylase domain-containing protein [Nocardioides sp. CFH 31398]MCH1867835.1 transglycosylase domain-containing protein [Nocardioides sp. CFH 31398]
MSRPASERPRPLRIVSHLGVMVAVAAVMGVIVAGLAIPFAGVLGIGARNVAQSMEDLPEELETEALPQRSKIVDGAGNVIANVFDQNRMSVKLTDVSPKMREAIVAIEDYRFYQHGALDLRGTLRALVTNQASDGVVQGGSSITQQMVKLTLQQQADTPEERQAATDDTYARKLRELRYAIAFEDNYSKDWILERYLNLAYFGDGAYGIQAAAETYFDKDAADLNVRESAMLAGLVQNPSNYDPTNSPDRALQRRNVVLQRMADLDVISQKQARKEKKRNLGLNVNKLQNGCVSSEAAFFCDYVLKYLADDEDLGKNPAERRRTILTGGLTIKTTIDTRMQAAADSAVAGTVFPTDQAIGGIAMIQPGTGAVRAISQSRPMGADQAAGETYLNYVVPQRYGDSNGFQPGSTFKLFVVAAALEQGMSPYESISSPETVSLDAGSFEVCDGEYYGSSEVWSPSNSTTSGTMNMYSGTQNSVNTYFAQLEQRTGICEPYTLAQEMGVELDNPETEMVPSFTLGVSDVSPLEMAEAYSTFAGRGVHCAARPIIDIADAAGNVLKTYDDQCEQVLSENTADRINDILRGVMEGGFGSGLQLTQPSAGKTGTTQDGKAVWFNGYTPNLATAAMIAGANEFGEPIPLAGVPVGGAYRPVSGSGFAGPMWADAMRQVDPILDDEDFVPPAS